MSDKTQQTLYPIPDGVADLASPALPARASAPPRLRKAERHQVTMHCESLDQRLPAEHLARDVWDFVQGLDLTPLLQNIQAVEGQAGRDSTDPHILLAIWLFAFAEGQGSARAVARLCERDRAYEWLCGGVTVNYHLLADSRVAHWDYLNQVFTDSLAALMQEGLLDLRRTAQDGMRVQASAGKSSFRRRQTLENCLAHAQERVAQLNQDFENGSATGTLQEKAARERAAQERVQRVQDALTQVQDLAQQREARAKGSGNKARASTTDPDARNMKMPDGGFRPGYNVQFATATVSGLIAGVDVTNQGTDAGLMDPMLEQVEQRTGRVPEEHLTDGGFATIEDIEKVTARGTTVFTPIKDEAKKQAAGIDAHQPRPKDSPAIGDWRQRMGTEESAHDLQAARPDGGMDQRPGAQPELLQGTRTQPAQGAGNRPVVRSGPQPAVCARLRAERAQAAAKAQSATAEA